MLTSRGLGLLATTVALWLASRLLGVAALQMAAVASLLLVIAAIVFTGLTSTRLQVDRVVRPGKLFFDAEGSVSLTVVNSGRLPTARVELLDRVPLVLADRSRATIEPIPPGGRASITYRLHGAQRGRFQVGPVEVRLLDPFGLVARKRTLPGTTPVTVYPPVWRLPAGLALGGATATGDNGRRRPLPSGEDLANVREYVRGDDLRTVHWATTAHRGKLMVRQPEAPQDPRAVVVLDVRADRHAGAGPGASIETAVAAAASAGYHLASRGRAVVLLDRPMTRPPKALPWEAWLEALADTTTEPVDIGALLHQIGQGIAGDGTLVAVLTVPDAAEQRRLVRAGRGFSTRIALLVDADNHRGGRPRAGADPATTVAMLRTAGWRTTLLRRGDRLDERWRELLVQQRAVARASTASPGGPQAVRR